MSDQDDVQWTEQARDRFRTAANELVDAIRTHSEALLAMTGRQAEYPTLFEAGDKLAKVLSAYADAQFELTGTVPPMGLPQNEPDEYEEDTDQEPAEPVGRVSVLHRADYRVTDAEAIMQAGRSAYLTAWPHDTEEDAAVDVNHLGRAFYQLMHVGGLSSLAEAPGLETAGATTWILESVSLLDEREPDNWPDNPFALGDEPQERLLFIFEEQ